MSLTQNLQLTGNIGTKDIKISGFFKGTSNKPQFEVYNVSPVSVKGKNMLVIYYGNTPGDINLFNNDTDKKITIPSSQVKHPTDWDTTQDECTVLFYNDNDFGSVKAGLRQPGQKDKDIMPIAWL